MRAAIWGGVVALVTTVLAWFFADVVFPDATKWLREPAFMPRWGFVALAISPAIASAAVAWAITKHRYNRPPKQHRGFFNVAASPDASFKPSELHHPVIGVLRSIDDCRATPAQVAARMVTKAPNSDVKQALDQLVQAGWAGSQPYAIGNGTTEYWLKGPGLEYARRKRLPVLSAEELDRLRPQLGAHGRRY